MKKWIPVLFSVLLAWNVWLSVRIARMDNQGILPGTAVEENVVHSYSSEVTEAVARTEDSAVLIRAGEDYYTGFVYAQENDTVYIICRASLAGSAGSVVFRSGRAEEAAVVGTDELLDIAVLAVHPSFQVEAAALGDSDLVKAGEYTIALTGRNPQTQRASIGFGVVSRTGYDASTGMYEMLETDARLHNGAAGGILLNLSGEVIGYMPSVDGRAVSVNELNASAREIIEQGEVSRLWLGVVGDDVSGMKLYHRSAWNLPLDLAEGICVLRVLPDSPAFGVLSAGDVIISLNDVPVNSRADLRNWCYTAEISGPVQAGIVRGTERMTVELQFE